MWQIRVVVPASFIGAVIFLFGVDYRQLPERLYRADSRAKIDRVARIGMPEMRRANPPLR